MNTSHRFIVTGAASTLGAAFVRLLSDDRSVRVLATTRGKERPASWGEGFKGTHLAGVDLLDASALSKLTAAASELEGDRLHVINCVGCFPGYRSVSETDVPTARKVYEANVLTVQATASALCDVMKRVGGGHFIAFSSHAVPQAYPLMGAFLSAKSALETFVRCVANEHARDGIVATAIALATLDSPIERALLPTADHARWVQPEQVCRFVRHMVDDPTNANNGNTVQFFNYSPSYFGQSYADRTGQKV